jgi:uncharacterized protein
VSEVIAPWLDRAAAEVEQVAGLLNATNLFPVADADTGTNLLVTLKAAARGANESGLPGATRAALVEAAGNSGVILSEILRGLEAGLASGWASAWVAADAAAQAAVSSAKPGTILSVTKAIAEVAQDHTGSDAELAMGIWVAARQAALDTAEHPPIPQAQGTVDAGAHGLERVVAAFAAVVGSGDCAPLSLNGVPVTAPAGCVTSAPVDSGFFEVMYLLDECSAEGAALLRERLNALGDSVLVVGDSTLWNVHVHLAEPGPAIDAGLAVGRPSRIRITPLFAPTPERTLIVVSNGSGLTALMKESGARVIDASAGRRPDAQEFVAAVEGAREAILLPHDQRSLTAAADAVEALRLSGIRVAVLPTKSTVQVLAALAVHDANISFDDDLVTMTAAAGHTRYATLATALRDGIGAAEPYRKGDLLGLIHGDVVVVGKDLTDTSLHVLERLVASGGSLLTLVSGEDAPHDLINVVVSRARELQPEMEIQTIDGGQAFYPLLMGLE